MRKYLAAALLGLLFVSAAGCAGTKEAGEQPAETENGAGNEAEEEDASGGLKAPEGELSEEGRSAYHSVLLDVYFNHLFPNDRDYGFLEGADVSENEFAVCDVDQDGAAELLISYTTTDEAGKTALIYDFEAALDMVREEFSGYPPLVFYDNGYVVLKEDRSQEAAEDGGVQGSVLYRYDAEGDTYIRITEEEEAASALEGAQELAIPWQKLTEENIDHVK